MSIKLIATDLDGTLLMPDHVHVSEVCRDTLAEAARRGIKIVIASGRTHGVFPAGIRELDFISYAIMSNGASMMEYAYPGDMSIVSHTAVSELPYEVWIRVYREMSDAGAEPEIYALGGSYMDMFRSERYKSDLVPVELVRELKSHISFVDDVTKTLKGRSIEKICSLTVPENTKLCDRLCSDPELEITTSIPGNIEVNYRGTSKGRALEKLCGMLGIKSDEVMAIGDAGNDIEMLRFAGCSVAMGNAGDDVKAVCGYVTGNNENDGVADAVMRLAFR